MELKSPLLTTLPSDDGGLGRGTLVSVDFTKYKC